MPATVSAQVPRSSEGAVESCEFANECPDLSGTIPLYPPLRLMLEERDESAGPPSPGPAAGFVLECGAGTGAGPGPSRRWELRASSQREREQWMCAIDPSYQFAITNQGSIR